MWVRADFVLSMLLILVCAACSDAPSGIATDAELAAALDVAVPGDEIHLAAGTFAGGLTIPAGVALLGAGASETTIASTSGVALDLARGSGVTRVAALTIESSGEAGIIARPDLEVVIEDVVVTATLGIGIGAEGVRSLTLSRTEVVGRVRDEADASGEPLDGQPSDTSSHGIVIVNGIATLTDVTVRGWSNFGALFLTSTVSWTGGGVVGCLGNGLLAAGGTSTLAGVAIEDIWQGLRLVPAYGIVTAYDAELDATDLMIVGSRGYGMLQSEATVDLERAIISENRNAGLWVQNSLATYIGNSTFDANTFASFVGVTSSGITIEGSRMSDTQLATRLVGETRSVEVGDGLQLVGSVEDLTVTGTELLDNARAGLVWHLDALPPSAVRFEGVAVDGTGEMIGAIAQAGTPPAGWDVGVERRGATLMNDASLSRELDTVTTLAVGDIPAVDALMSSGLEAVGIIMPMD